MADSAYERLEKDVTQVKNDIAALTTHVTEAVNELAASAKKQTRSGYKQAVDDLSQRSGVMKDAVQDAASTVEETLEDVITQRPLATVGLALGLGFLIGVTWRR